MTGCSKNSAKHKHLSTNVQCVWKKIYNKNQPNYEGLVLIYWVNTHKPQTAETKSIERDLKIENELNTKDRSMVIHKSNFLHKSTTEEKLNKAMNPSKCTNQNCKSMVNN